MYRGPGFTLCNPERRWNLLYFQWPSRKKKLIHQLKIKQSISNSEINSYISLLTLHIMYSKQGSNLIFNYLYLIYLSLYFYLHFEFVPEFVVPIMNIFIKL